MDKVIKFLKKLSEKELIKVLDVIDKIESGKTKGVDIKRLSGHKNIFRARVGKIRIIFIKSKEEFHLITVERRSDTTYDL